MPLLGYKSWQKFNYVIETAKENLETVVSSTSSHITPTVNVVARLQDGGSNQANFHLSRLACYHVALSCDSRGNDQVKAAKHYFAIKTREAEVKVPALTEQNEALRLELELTRAKQKLLDTRNTIVATLPPALADRVLGIKVVKEVEYIDRTITTDGSTYDGVGVTYVQKAMGFKSTRETWAWLESIGYGKDSGHWQLELTAVESSKLSRQLAQDIIAQWRRGNRQRFISEDLNP